MVTESDKQQVTIEKNDTGGGERNNGVHTDQERGESLEENLEKLAALNLGSDQSLQPRLSTSVIRLVSALAGIGALLLIYFIMKLFI